MELWNRVFYCIATTYLLNLGLRDHCGQRDRFLRAKVIVKLFLLHISNVISIESHKHECLNMTITSIQSQKHNCLNMRWTGKQTVHMLMFTLNKGKLMNNQTRTYIYTHTLKHTHTSINVTLLYYPQCSISPS